MHTTESDLDRRDRTRRRGALLSVGLAAVAIILAACAGPEPSPEESTGPESDAIAFAQCMRENGIPEWPDPEPRTGDASGPGQSAQAPEGVDPEEVREAMEACSDLVPSGPAGGPGSDGDGAMDAMLEFAQCMRDHGIEEFPDPQDNGVMVPPGVDPDSEEFRAADEACRELLGGPQQGQGGEG